MFIITALVFIGLLMGLVLAHEFGHFLAAKRAGCRVEEFGFGFPPKIAGIKYKGTLYTLNILPLGGFVKIEGEDMEEKHPAHTSFASKSALWRIIILSAGVSMNVVLAFVLLTLQAGIGYPTVATDTNQAKLTGHQTYIIEVSPNSPATQAGINAYDRVLRIGKIENPTIEQIQKTTVDNAGKQIDLEIDREGSHKTVQLTPRVNPPAGEGAIGLSLASTGLTRVAWWQAPWYGLQRTGAMLWAIVSQFAVILQRLVMHGNAGTSLTGPIGIAIYTNEATKMGVSYVLEFAALISLNLAIINILPLPALDGGRIAFVLYEKIRRKRASAKFEQMTHAIGFGLLIFLMIIITLKDIRRFF